MVPCVSGLAGPMLPQCENGWSTGDPLLFRRDRQVSEPITEQRTLPIFRLLRTLRNWSASCHQEVNYEQKLNRSLSHPAHLTIISASTRPSLQSCRPLLSLEGSHISHHFPGAQQLGGDLDSICCRIPPLWGRGALSLIPRPVQGNGARYNFFVGACLE